MVCGADPTFLVFGCFCDLIHVEALIDINVIDDVHGQRIYELHVLLVQLEDALILALILALLVGVVWLGVSFHLVRQGLWF